jgi:hypothetical protein
MAMMSDLSQIREVFAEMAADGWDVSEPLQYGYFFFSLKRKSLEAAERWLSEKGYKAESYHKTDDGEWVLQMSKAEVHSPESLHKRNQAMNDLAEHFEIDLYDGWDVGQIPIPARRPAKTEENREELPETVSPHSTSIRSPAQCVLASVIVFFGGWWVVRGVALLIISQCSMDVYVRLCGRSPACPFWEPWWGFWCLELGSAGLAFLAACATGILWFKKGRREAAQHDHAR